MYIWNLVCSLFYQKKKMDFLFCVKSLQLESGSTDILISTCRSDDSDDDGDGGDFHVVQQRPRQKWDLPTVWRPILCSLTPRPSLPES